MTPLADATDAAIFGGKAAELAASLRRGLPVPGGFALATSEVDALCQSDSIAIESFASMLDATGGCVAVRSSAIGEDGASASFAGMHATVLHVRTPAALVDAIKRVWASARSDAALAYRRRMNVAGEPRMAVVVQTLVDAECAGVLFTKNPMTGNDERVVESAWGLGETVVAGLVTPDRYRIARSGEILERTAGEKDIAVRCAPSGGTAEVAVHASKVHALTLDDARLARLHALASACEAWGEGAHDIEWAFTAATPEPGTATGTAARDALFLLQRRAVTRTASASGTKRV